MQDKSICLVLPYFGPFPSYFNLWLSSCEYNSTVDFLLFTDNELSGALPKNVHVIMCTFAEFKGWIQDAFNFQIALPSPYKLCDYKPIYGYALKRFLLKYDFWGHCDCDLIFGDIRRFLDSDVLGSHDRILTRGHLTIYRNNTSVNKFFMRDIKGVVSWRHVLTSDESFAYDEWGGTSVMWEKIAPDRLYDAIVFDDIVPSKKNFISSQKIRYEVDENKDFFVFRFLKGRLDRICIDLRENKILMEPSCYVHFQKRDMKVVTKSKDEFMMVPNQFIDVVSPTMRLLRQWGRHNRFYWQAYKIKYKNLKRKISCWF